MTQFANTHDRYDLAAAASGQNARESLSDVITMISPTETPFQMRAGRTTASNTFEEWLKDSLAAAATNKQIEGDTFAADTDQNAAERLGNYLQISWAVISVSRRADKVKKAGRKSEVAYQLRKKGLELKRDKEYALVGGGGHTVASHGNSSTAGTLASIGAWLATNTDRGASGTDPSLSGTTTGYPSSVASLDGTDRALTEDGILGVVASCYTAGGNPSICMCGPLTKQNFSKYMFGASARIADPYQDHGKSPKGGLTVTGSVSYFVTDFGTLEVVPNRFQREDDFFILDMDHWEVAYLDDMTTVDIAKTADSTQKALICDYTLISREEAASGIYADVDETVAMTAA